MPLTVGGGIRKIEDIQNLIRSGADKITINTQAIENFDFVRRASERFGSQCIVASLDYTLTAQGYRLLKGGKIIERLQIVDHVLKLVTAGIGELLLTSVERNGTMKGYDLGLTKLLSSMISVPIITCGGAGKLDHFSTALKEGGASSVAASSFFHFTDQNILKTKSYLRNSGAYVRKI